MNIHSLFVEKGHELEAMIKDPDERLAALNLWLSDRGLKPRESIGGNDGEQLILGIYHVDERTPRFHRTIYCAVCLKDGRIIELPMRYNANGAVSDGAVFVVIIEHRGVQYLALVKEWRHSVGDWVTGLPRGFTEDEDVQYSSGGSSLGSLEDLRVPGVRVLLREMSEEIGDDAVVGIRSVASLGKVFQNTGTDSAAPDIFLVSVVFPPEQDMPSLGRYDGEVDHKSRLVPIADVPGMIGSTLCDMHTLTALLLADRYLRSLSVQNVAILV